jgi:energy-coupling factor transporter ATP-binding protein EcfA2
MELNSFSDCLVLAKTATPETIGEVQRQLYTAATELALNQSEVEQLLKTLKDSTGVTLGALKGDFSAYLKANGLTAEKDSVATEIVKLALDDGLELWHAPEGEAWATIRLEDHCEHHPLKAKAFRNYLKRLHYEAKKTAAHSQGVQDALGTLESKAVFDGEAHETFVRLAEVNGHIYLDLANGKWQAVEVTPGGWCVLDSRAVPVRFKRSKGMESLPIPVKGGNLAVLGDLLNLQDGPDLKLVIGWLLQTMRGDMPFPVLVFTGEPGSGKSTASKVLRKLIDPNKVPLRTLSRNEHEMLIAASNSWCICYENLRGLNKTVSDSLCRLATGGGTSARELYSDADEALFDAKRPVLLNGISGIIEEPDLVDRALQVTLPRIDDEEREYEEVLWPRFDKAAPSILGALLDAVAGGLAALPHTQLERKPRMADFARWVTACEGALGWEKGAFMEAHDGAKASLTRDALEAEPVAAHLIALAEAGGWTGTASELLAKLNDMAGYAEGKRPPKGWPGAGHVLSKQLARLAPALRRQGIEAERHELTTHKKSVLWTLRTVANPSLRSARSAREQGQNTASGGLTSADASAEASPHTEAPSPRSPEPVPAPEHCRGRNAGSAGARNPIRSKYGEQKKPAEPWEDF